MLLILEEYFKDYPVRLRILEGLYRRGIAVRNGKFYADEMEIPISEIAKVFRVNRRTVYETVKAIEENREVRKIMESLNPALDRSNISPLVGNQIIWITPRIGCFSFVLKKSLEVLGPYLCNAVEISGKNSGKKEQEIRIIFTRPLPEGIVDQLSTMGGMEKFNVTTPDLDSDHVVCNACEVKDCPSKLSSTLEIRQDALAD
ncbi:MAG: regulator [Candidatus Thermoplasmatota archaeon]|jgi:predicted regulator of amino acid metabolism with ACT domain|nr:regulator [Candidatus Thermoplasmatota archaeon]MCL5793886.1 regulator [Candidatus Thermoplasmatota archaeon]